MNKEKLTLTPEEAREILWGDDDRFEVVEDEIVGKRRWSVDHRIVIKRLSDGKFFADYYSRAITEIQDEQPWEYTEPNFVEVFPVEKKIVVYQ
ncbi:MAG: hypothetical protein Q8O88_02275 [bacterium]|nr:hypothetical protein [bacterium]